MDAKLRVAVLTSSPAPPPGMEQFLDDPNRGTVWELADVITRKRAPRNFHEREAFDHETAELLRDAGAEIVVLDDYHYIVTRPLLEAFPGKMLALHDGDLSVRDEHGARRWAMLHAVRRAVFAGATETRASLFFVTQRVGEGPLMLLGPAFPVSGIAADAIARGAYDVAIAYAGVHRQWMTRLSYGPLFMRAMQFLAAGTLEVARDVVWIDGAPGPCRLGEGPRACHERGDAIRRGIPASCPFIAP